MQIYEMSLDRSEVINSLNVSASVCREQCGFYHSADGESELIKFLLMQMMCACPKPCYKNTICT